MERHIFRSSDCRLNIRNLVRLLDPKFAEEGSNLKRYQKEVYTAFYRYIREVAAGRRVTGKTTFTLNHILQFTCGADEEPVLGFSIPPQIICVSSSGYFLPSSNTCTNTFNLPCPSSTASLPLMYSLVVHTLELFSLFQNFLVISFLCQKCYFTCED